MFSLIVGGLISYFINCILVGTTVFSIVGTRLVLANHWKGILLFMVIFAGLDLYYLPMLADLDVSIRVGNKEVAEFFELTDGYTSLNEIYGFGTIDLVEWFFEAVIGYFSGLYVFQNVVRRNLTGR